MKRQSLALLVVAFVAAGVLNCFKDPVSGLRSGPTILSVDHSSIYVLAGDSTTVVATVMDNGGNVLPETDALWTSADPTVAAVRKDTTKVIPGNYFTRAFIRGVNSLGGITSVTVTSRGLTYSVRVVVIPPLLPSGYSVSGTATADTVLIPAQIGPPPVAAHNYTYTAGDTLTINGTAFLNFDTSKVAAYITGPSGVSTGYLVAKTPQQIKVVFTTGAYGKVVVSHWLYLTGVPAVGTQPLDSLILKDSLSLARVRFRGTVTQSGDTTVFNAPAGVAFTSGTTVQLNGIDSTGASVLLTTQDATAAAIIIRQSATQVAILMTGAAKDTVPAVVTLNGVTLYGATVSNYNTVAKWKVTPAAFTYPALLADGVTPTVTQLGDTLTVTATGAITFDGTTRVAVGATKDSVISYDAQHLNALALAASTGTVNVTNAKVGTGRVASLKTAASFTTTVARLQPAMISQAGDTLTITVTAPVRFDALTRSVFVGTKRDSIIYRPDSLHLSIIAPATGTTGAVKVDSVIVGGARLAALSTVGSYTIPLATFPAGMVTQAGDTLYVTVPAAGPVRFDATSGVSVGSTADKVFAFDSLHLSALATPGSTGTVNVTNSKVGVARIPSLKTAATFTTNTATFPGTVTQAGDTVTITGTATAKVDSLTTVSFGTTPGAILSASGNTLKVLAAGPSTTGVVSLGNVLVGIVRISLKTTATYTTNAAQFLGTIAQVGDTMTITAPTGMTFDASTGAAFGTGTSIILSQTSSTMKMLSTATWTGVVVVTNAKVGSVRIPALTTTASYTINGSAFPSANVNLGGGKLGDTITVTAPAGMKFDTAAGQLSMVMAGNLAIATSDTAWTLSRTPTTIKAFAKRGGGGPVRVTNIVLGTGTNAKVLPFLPTAVNMPIDSIASDFPQGAMADSTSGVHVLTVGTPNSAAGNTQTVYGSLYYATGGSDFWSYQTNATRAMNVSVAWFGSGSPYGTGQNTGAYTDDIDLLVCTVTNPCDESAAELLGGTGETATNPQSGTTASLPPGTRVWVGLLNFGPPGATYAVVYQLTVTLQ